MTGITTCRVEIGLGCPFEALHGGSCALTSGDNAIALSLLRPHLSPTLRDRASQSPENKADPSSLSDTTARMSSWLYPSTSHTWYHPPKLAE